MAGTGQQALALLREAGCQFTLTSAKPSGPEELSPLLSNHDAVLAGVEPYSAEILSSRPAAQVKIISRWGVGYDSIDISAASDKGIVVTNTPGFLDEAVADYTFALFLSLARQIHTGYIAMKAGDWRASWGCDVAGKTLGLIGCGRIGMAVARRASGFNLRVLAFDPRPSPEGVSLGIQFVSMDELLAQSDFVSLHAAFRPENRNMIGEAQLRKMKPTALLINAARGALLDESALVRALRENWIAGAALDVFAEEPLPLNSPLRTAPNLLLTPHQASFAHDTGERVSMAAARAILDLLAGRRPQFALNPDVFASPQLRAKIQ